MAAPANDLFINAQDLIGDSGTVTGSSVDSGGEAGEPTVSGAVASVWFAWTPSANGTATVNTYGSGYDTTIGVYTGDAVDALSFVAENDDFGGVPQSQVSFDVASGTTYRIAVGGYGGATGDYQLSWSLASSGGGGIDGGGGVGGGLPDPPESLPQGTVLPGAQLQRLGLRVLTDSGNGATFVSGGPTLELTDGGSTWTFPFEDAVEISPEWGNDVPVTAVETWWTVPTQDVALATQATWDGINVVDSVSAASWANGQVYLVAEYDSAEQVIVAFSQALRHNEIGITLKSGSDISYLEAGPTDVVWAAASTPPFWASFIKSYEIP